MELASQGATLFSQGESVESLKIRIDKLEAEVLILKSQLQRYKDLHGELPPEVVGESAVANNLQPPCLAMMNMN